MKSRQYISLCIFILSQFASGQSNQRQRPEKFEEKITYTDTWQAKKETKLLIKVVEIHTVTEISKEKILPKTTYWGNEIQFIDKTNHLVVYKYLGPSNFSHIIKNFFFCDFSCSNDLIVVWETGDQWAYDFVGIVDGRVKLLLRQYSSDALESINGLDGYYLIFSDLTTGNENSKIYLRKDCKYKLFRKDIPYNNRLKMIKQYHPVKSGG